MKCLHLTDRAESHSSVVTNEAVKKEAKSKEVAMSNPLISSREQLSRRELGKVALGGALGATLLGSSRSSSAVVRPQPPGIKLGSAAPVDPTDEDLLFFKQLGVDCVFCAVKSEFNSVEGLLNIKKRYADAGLTVHNVRNLPVTNN